MRKHPDDLRIQRNGLHALYDLTYDANYENVPWAHERGIMAVRAGANEVYKEAASRLVSRLRRLDQVEDLECGIPFRTVFSRSSFENSRSLRQVALRNGAGV